MKCVTAAAFALNVLVLAGAGALAACAETPSNPAPAAETATSRSGATRAGHDWPSFLGRERNATSRETGIRTDWPLPIVWQTEIAEGYSAPSVADGRLFLFDRVDDRARLRCHDAETGAELWQSSYATAYEDMYGYSGGPRAAPVVDDALVYTYDAAGRLRAWRVTDGAVAWEIDTEKVYGLQQNFFGVGSTPIVEGDLLIVPVGGSPAGSPGVKSGETQPNGTAIVAFDKRTGAERYRLGDELASYASPIVVDHAGRRLGLHFARGGLLGFDATKGTVSFHLPWRAKLLESVNAATPVVVGDRVFVTETYGPGGVLLRLPTGDDEPTIVWQDERRARSIASHWSTPVHHRGYLYGSSGRSTGDATLRAVALATGKVAWSEPGLGRATLLLVDDHLVVLGEHGTLWLVKATPERFTAVAEWKPLGAAGKPLLRSPAWNAPILARGLLYVRGADRLLAMELIPSAPSPVAEEDSPIANRRSGQSRDQS